MNKPMFIVAYYDGIIIDGQHGKEYCGGSQVTFRMKRNINYAMLVGKLHVKVNDGTGRRISQILYRYPVMSNNSTVFSTIDISSDDDVRAMVNIFLYGTGLTCMELYLEYESILSEGDYTVCMDGVNHPNTSATVDVGPSSSGMDNRAEFPIVARTSNRLLSDESDDDSGNDDSTGDQLDVDGNTIPGANYSHQEIPESSGRHTAEALYYVPSSQHFSQINWEAMRVTLEPTELERQLADGSDVLHAGRLFKTKEDVQSAVKRFHIARNFHYRVVESKPSYWSLKCLRQHDQNCKWKLRAVKKQVTGLWEITRYPTDHTCVSPSLSQDHSQIDANLICECIMDTVAKQPDWKVKAIIANIKTQFNYTVSYRKAWEGKMKSIARIFGDWDESYNQLPSWLHAMQEANPGTVVDLKTKNMGTAGYAMFDKVFWAFKPAIDGFNHCIPVLLIDGTHLYGKYKGTLLIASGVDGDGFIFPVAFAIVEKESGGTWGWFLGLLRSHVTSREGLCIISDRHAGIISAMNDEHLGWAHRYCLRHVVANFHKVIKKHALRGKLHEAGVQMQPRKFDKLMEEMKSVDPFAAAWPDSYRVDKKMWSLAYDEGGMRYGHTTTNVAESVNGTLKGVRGMPITALIQHTFFRSVEVFEKRRSCLLIDVQSGPKWTDKCMRKYNKWARAASGHSVRPYASDLGVYTVETAYRSARQKGQNEQIVRLQDKVCSCGKFQAYKIPCSHVIAVCYKYGLDPMIYISSFYTMDTTLKCYGTYFQPVGHSDYWQRPPGPIIIPNPACRRGQGRPQSSRYTNEMDWRMPISSQCCSKCNQSGHNRKTCPAP